MATMADHFDPDLLDLMARRREVTIETARASGEPRQTVIWIVVVDGDAYIRSVRGARGAWFRELTQQGSAALRVAGRVVPVGAEAATDDATVEAVSAALIAKYGTGASTVSMLQAETLPTTIRLRPQQ
jgi:hypothetical protein